MPRTSPLIGKYVICRCYSAGVHAGVLVEKDGEIAVLTEARRLWKWTAKNGVALNGVAFHGLKASESKIDSTVSEIELSGVIEVISTTEQAEASIRGA
ncbi:MAG: hypothetical protein RLZZ524_2999 [Pseudomonadota bacterium]